MTSVAIPTDVQIDAALTGRAWNLVHRYCDGAWGDLASKWTVSFEEIANEAKRRGLQCFVSAKPTSEGFWLVEADGGYEVFYVERGIRMHQAHFAELEPAFAHWLDQELRSHLLPGRAEP